MIVETDNQGETRICLLVMGMHRSGTSALTRALNLLGAQAPLNVVEAGPSNEAGHREPKRLVELHDAMLEELNSSWRDWRGLNMAALGAKKLKYYKQKITDLLIDEFGNSKLFVLKDPRICRFLPLYHEILDSMGINSKSIIIFRNPLEVAASLAARDGLPEGISELLWLRHYLDAERDTRDVSRVFLTFQELIEAPSDALAKLSKFLSIPNLSTKVGDDTGVASSIRSHLRHHRDLDDELERNQAAEIWIKPAYHSLNDLAKNIETQVAIDRLDAIRTEFDLISPFFAGQPYVTNAEVIGSKQFIIALKAEIDRLTNAMDEI